MWEVLDFYSSTSSSHNEDLFFTHDDFAVLMDGASGLVPNVFSKDRTDAAWYVEQVKTTFMQKACSTLSIQKVLESTIDSLHNKYFQEKMLKPEQYPSASIAALKKNKHTIQLFLLGDCTMLIKYKSGQVHLYQDSRVRNIDQSFFELCRSDAIANNISFSQAVNRSKDIVVANRRKKNTEDGYWILGTDKESISHGYLHRLKLDLVDCILIMTDGFELGLGIVSISSKRKGVIDNVLKEGLHAIGSMIHNELLIDSEFSKYPRYKLFDDATAVLLSP